MAKPKWTPAPWSLGSVQVYNREHDVYHDDPHEAVIYADCAEIDEDTEIRVSGPNASADATLIAAAPELYEALSKLAHEVAAVCELAEAAIRESAGNTNYSVLWERQAIATLVLAKARGE